MLLYLIRHGEPDYEHDALTPMGEKQARALASRFMGAPLAQVYTSPLGRAEITARLMCERGALTPVPLPWLAEIGADGYTRYPDGQLKFVITLPPSAFRTGKNRDLDYERAFLADGLADTNLQAYSRAVCAEGDRFLRARGYRRESDHYVCDEKNTERIAMVAHNGSIRLWLSYLLHIPLHIMFSSFTMAHTGVTVLRFEPEGQAIEPVCLCFSDMSHLLRENLPYLHRGVAL